jgi:phosphatidylglycerophosphate synthase
MISGLSLACSPIAYLLIADRAILASIFALFVVLLLDILDGAVARATDQPSEDGWMVDVSVDRVSETLISLALSRIFILFTIINMGLVLLSCHYGKHAIIPLRQATLLLLIAYYLLESLVGLQPAVSFLDKILFHW